MAEMTDTFYLGSMKVEPTAEGNFWIYPRHGRGRFILAGSSTARAITEGHSISLTIAAGERMAAGTHEPLVYFRNEQGKIGIPPDPSMIPTGFERLEARTLADVDRMMAEMSRESLADFTDEEGAFQEGLDAIIGNPRQHLVSQLGRSISNKERDVIHVMLKELDHEQAQRQKITTDVRHYGRDHGGY